MWEISFLLFRHRELLNFQVKTIQDEIDNWYPRVSDNILINYPSYVDLRFSMDAYDSMPMKRILHCIAVTLTMTGKQFFFQHFISFLFFCKSLLITHLMKNSTQILNPKKYMFLVTLFENSPLSSINSRLSRSVHRSSSESRWANAVLRANRLQPNRQIWLRQIRAVRAATHCAAERCTQ